MKALLVDKTFDIEFNGYLSNHAKHAIIALISSMPHRAYRRILDGVHDDDALGSRAPQGGPRLG
jgi:hypothetical protein